MPCPATACVAVPCLALPCLALPCLALPCLALPCLALPCLALPCLALPCLALPCLAFLHRCRPAGPWDRCRRCQTHLAHIRPVGFARNGRRLGPVGAMMASQSGARGSG